MKRLALFAILSLALMACGLVPPDTAGGAQGKDWVQLFNGKDLTGWKTHPKSPGKWEVKDGCIVGSGEQASHLFTERGDYENFEYRLEVKINDKGNSGQYFRAEFGPGYSPGYEAQINATHSDVIKTGSLYPGAALKLTKAEQAKMTATTVIKEQLHKPDEWFTQLVIANGNHIQIFVNGNKTVDYKDEKNTFTKGHLAIQGHDAMKAGGKVYPCIVHVRKAEVKELPPTKK
ncbi:MAG TPA: DUF1080 domain-containing protein [Gemmataceae bacterium]|nr:DUF1080 domain-containing protein [Gemmataceae bacterium]